jgi:predicted dehydrogenase
VLSDERGERPALVRQPFMAHERRLMIAEVLIHHLDTMRYLCGPLRVIGARTGNPVAGVVAGESLAAIFLESATGAPIEVVGTMAAAGYPARTGDRLELLGTQASAVLEGDELRLLSPQSRRQRFDMAAGYQASFDCVITHFVDCLRTGAAFETGPADNLETLRLVEHAYEAATATTPYR